MLVPWRVFIFFAANLSDDQLRVPGCFNSGRIEAAYSCSWKRRPRPFKKKSLRCATNQYLGYQYLQVDYNTWVANSYSLCFFWNWIFANSSSTHLLCEGSTLLWGTVNCSYRHARQWNSARNLDHESLKHLAALGYFTNAFECYQILSIYIYMEFTQKIWCGCWKTHHELWASRYAWGSGPKTTHVLGSCGATIALSLTVGCWSTVAGIAQCQPGFRYIRPRLINLWLPELCAFWPYRGPLNPNFAELCKGFW